MATPARILGIDPGLNRTGWGVIESVGGRVVCIDAGATCVIQPGGSMRDEEVIAAADERDIAMVFTGVRHFRH